MVKSLKIRRIFLMGLTSSALGNMETHNLGNYAIIEPFIECLKDEFPDAEIHTSIQMSDEFCQKYQITSLRDKRFWSYGLHTAFSTARDILTFAWFCILRIVSPKQADNVLKKSLLLKEILEADLVIDFSGDIFGDNANNAKFLEDVAELWFATLLNKKVVMLAGSPGPFKKRWRKFLARRTLNRLDFITNREPISTEILKSIGVIPSKIITTACPAFLFQPLSLEETKINMKEENLNLDMDKPNIGMILCGWNMPEPPFSRIPRKEYELAPFVPVVESLLNDIDANVILFAHQNRSDENGNLIYGNDYYLLEQLFNMIAQPEGKGTLTLIKGKYDAATLKGFIGSLDMLISGRIHGAVAGLSQCVPTVIIDYGHEPKAHKLRGFARLVNQDNVVANPADTNDMLNKVHTVWKNRKKIQQQLEKRIPEVQALARSNFQLLKQLFD